MDCHTLSAQPGALPARHIQLRDYREEGPCVVLGRPAVYVDLHSYRPPPLAAGLRLERAGLEGWRPRGRDTGVQYHSLVHEREGVDQRVLVHALAHPGGQVRQMHAVEVAWGEGCVRVRGRTLVAREARMGWDEALVVVAYGGAVALGDVIWQHDGEHGWTRHDSPRAWREAVVRPWLVDASVVQVRDQLGLARERRHRGLVEMLEGALGGAARRSA